MYALYSSMLGISFHNAYFYKFRFSFLVMKMYRIYEANEKVRKYMKSIGKKERR